MSGRGPDPHAVTPLSAIERACLGVLVFFAGVLAFVLVSAFCGCANTPSGVRVVASSVSATNLGDINWDEYKIPVFSIYTGPRTTVWVNRNYLALKKVSASGSVTNDVSALGIYSCQEQKGSLVELEFKEASGNENEVSRD